MAPSAIPVWSASIWFTSPGRSFAQPFNLAEVGAQRQAEHVGDHFFPQFLTLELLHQTDEDLVGDMGQRRPHAVGCRELGNQNHRLADDAVD